ncbi:Ig-like domain-containing protein [candidate division KSB1 bacterium]|nr:Ig-like domain-containing protein [candidate division KSB1 bacterium]
MARLSFIFLFLASVVFSQPVHQQLLYHNPLTGEMVHEFASVENYKGQFTSAGWKASQSSATVENNSRLIIRFANRLPASGTIEFKVTNFNPAKQADYSKSHIFFLTSQEGGKSDVLYTNGSWCYLRTGKSYVNSDGSVSMRIDLSSKGLTERKEDFFLNSKFFNLASVYRFKIVYNQYYFWIFIDDQLIEQYTFSGQERRFRELYLGGDIDYLTIDGPVYSDLEIRTADTELFFEDKTYSKNLFGLGDPHYSGHGIAMGDVNDDGLTDVYISNCYQGECLRDVLHIQQPNGTFADETMERGVADECCSHGVVFVDVDNDGDLDLFNGNTWEPNQLYINDGNGYFTEESVGRGIELIDGETRGVVAFDANNDGYIDLYAVNWGMENELYINDGRGYFQRQYLGAEGAVEEIEQIGTQGVTVADIDDDGDFDIYISKRQKSNELYLNENGRFREAAAERGIAVGGRSDGATFADFDNDGDLDLFVANTKTPNIGETVYLNVFENLGNGYFVDHTQDYNLVMDGFTVQLFDADNDGWLDLYRLRNNGYIPDAMAILSLNNGQKGFVSAGFCGADVIGADARGCAIDDLDRDGDLDIFITNKLFDNIFLENHLDRRNPAVQNSYLQIDVNGPRGDRGGIGSKIWIYEAGHLGNSAYLLGYRQVTNAVGYLSGSNLVQHFGLGNRVFVDIRVQLVDGSSIERRQVAAGQRILIEPEAAPRSLERISGDGQSGYAGQQLANPLVVRVRDASGQFESAVPVTFRIVRGSGRIIGDPTIDSDDDGFASIYLQLGSAPDTCVVQATVAGLQGDPLEFTALVLETPLVLAIESGDDQTGEAGALLPKPVVVSVQTIFGEPAAGKSVDFRVIEGGGTLQGISQISMLTDADGLAQAHWRLGPNAGAVQTLSVSIGTSEVFFRAEAVADLPVRMVPDGGEGQSLRPGQLFAEPFAVRVLDRWDNAVADWPVVWSSSGGASLDGDTFKTSRTDSQGRSAVTWQAGPYLGPEQKLSARSEAAESSLEGSPIEWIYSAISVDQQQSSIVATGPVFANGSDASTITVTLRDRDGASVGAGLTVSISVSGSGNLLSQPDTLTDASGRVSAFLQSTIAEQKTVSAVVKGIDLTLGETMVEFQQPVFMPMELIAVSGKDQTGAAGRPLAENLRVRILDQSGMPLAGAPVVWSVVAGGGSVNGGASVQTFSDSLGLTAVSWILGTVASSDQRLQAKVPESNVAPVIFEAICRPAELAELQKIGGDHQVGTVDALLPSPFFVRAVDPYGNTIPDLILDFTVVRGTGTFEGSASHAVVTDSTGSASAHFRCGVTAGEISIKAAHQSVFIYFNAIAKADRPDAQRSTLQATSPIRPDGIQKSTITITLLDRFENPVLGRFVELISNDQDCILIQPTQPTDNQGVTTGSLASTSPGRKVVSAFVLPDSSILLQQAMIDFDFGRFALLPISGNNQIAPAGTTLTNPLTVRIVQNEAGLAGVGVVFKRLTGSASFSGSVETTVISDSDGFAHTAVDLGTLAGPVRIKVFAASDSTASTEFLIKVVPGQPSELSKRSGDGQVAQAGERLENPLVVQIFDRYQNLCSGVPINFSSINGGTILGSGSVESDSLGLAFCQVQLGSEPGEYYFDAKLNTGQVTVFSATATQGNSAPQILGWQPSELEVSIQLGESVEFRITDVRDSEGDSLSCTWLIQGAPVGHQPVFNLLLTSAAFKTFTLTCRVSDGKRSSEVVWRVQVLTTSMESVVFSALPLQSEPGVLLQWHVPQPGSVREFVVLRSLSAQLFAPLEGAVVAARADRYHYEFRDREINGGETYRYILQMIGIDGQTDQSEPIQIHATLPQQIALYPNYPNPFNPTTTLAFDLPGEMQVDLAVFNVSGQRIRTLLSGKCAPGKRQVVWNGRDDNDESVPSGVYLYRLQAGETILQRKLLLVK